MNYFKLDIKRLLSSKMVRLTILILLAISILDPLTVLNHFSRDPNMMKEIGKNPFQFWMLMNSVSWGNNLYNTMFWIFPVLLTGLIYFDDKNTSMYMLQVTRDSKNKYIMSKLLSTWLFSFIVMLVALEINIIVTYKLFSENMMLSEHYHRIAPNKGTFVYNAFSSNPMKMVQIYTVLNAFAISIFSVFSICIHMIFKLTNRYIALLMPVIILYGIRFIFDSLPMLFIYNIRMILQPRATSALEFIITWKSVILTFGVWILVNCILTLFIFVKSRDCYE
ncbi:hypothetical protein [Tissierella creatinophila]|uniref:ABC-2 family transporter protein n=1 Tax=Tissierella creatinophila DSM 6911 TaxID=1123403 RepID=A0A1U7M4G9_TISCR|nr:hypothetical protein [Tissierella creatinophila]OLS02214.1 ABC-2 family transporter protein [Tissierella creatinophila DSM 6911]